MFLNFVLICVTLILCLIFLKFTFESLFANYVFECIIYFVSYHCMAWGHDYFFRRKKSRGGWRHDKSCWLFHWRRLSSSTIIFKNSWLVFMFVYSYVLKFSTLSPYLLFLDFCLETYVSLCFWLIYACFGIFCSVSIVIDYI